MFLNTSILIFIGLLSAHIISMDSLPEFMQKKIQEYFNDCPRIELQQNSEKKTIQIEKPREKK